jgi:DNA-binding MarR family transcriptional regulator
MRVKELVPLIGTTSATITRHVQYLENLGLIERLPDENDGRSWILRLSPKGLEVADCVQRVRTSHLEQCLREWSNENIEQLVPLYSRLTQALSEGRELTEVDSEGVPRSSQHD